MVAAAIVGLTAATTCPTWSGTNSYGNTTGCTTAGGYLQTLCTCLNFTYNSGTGVCPFASNSALSCTTIAACINTYVAAINSEATGTLSGTCSQDLTVLGSNLTSFAAGTSSMWNSTYMYSACTAYACNIISTVAGTTCGTSYDDASCPSPLSSTIYLTFGGNWTGLIAVSARRARARSTASQTQLVNALTVDMTKIFGYVPTSVTLALQSNGEALATVVLPVTASSKSSFLAAYGAGGSALASLFPDLSYWFTKNGGTGFSFVGAGTTPTVLTPTPGTVTTVAPTRAPSAASVVAVVNALLAIVAVLLMA